MDQLPTTTAAADGFAACAAALPSAVPIMAFVKGDFIDRASGSTIPPGTLFRCMAAAFGWIRFHGAGEPPTRIIGSPGSPVPDRSELDDRDQTKWSVGLNGEPRDPWNEVAELALARDDTGAPMLFSATSDTGRRSVGQLAREVVWGRHVHGATAVPVVELQSRKLKNQYSTPVPSFVIVRWVTETGSNSNALPAPDPMPKTGSDSANKGLARAQKALQARLGNAPKDDLDDEIRY